MRILRGRVSVERGNLAARMICRLFGFPKPAADAPLQVDMQHADESMTWVRNFDGVMMKSRFRRRGKYLIEQLGALQMYMIIEVDGNALHYRHAKTRFFGIPMPAIFSPRVRAFEYQKDDHYRFEVDVRMWLIGRVITYRGKLAVYDAAGKKI